jgi:outer membrane protein TolC
VYDGRQETADAGELRVGVTVPVWRNGPIDRARANVRRAAHARTAASLGVVQQRLESLRTAAQRYWEWTAAGRRLVVARDLLGLAMARDAGLGERVTRGDLPEFERADNTRAVLQREGAVVLARRQLEQAAIELSLYLRDGRGEPRVPSESELPGPLPEPSPLDARCLPGELRAAEQRRPEPRRLAALRERERVERDFQENQSRPAVDVTLAASQDLGAGPQRLTTPAFEAGVTLEIPLLNRGPVGRARAAGAAGERIESQRRFALDRVAAEVRDAASALEAARERAALSRREAALASDLAGRERERLRLGDGTLLVLNLREVAAAEAVLREVDARLDWLRASVALRFAVGLAPPGPAPCLVAAPE